MLEKAAKMVKAACFAMPGVPKVARCIGGIAAETMVKKAAATVPVSVKRTQKTVQQITAVIPKYVDAGKQTGGQKAATQPEQSKKSFFQVLLEDVSNKNKNILRRMGEAVAQYKQEVDRGVTQKGVGYVLISGTGDTMNLLLQLRKPLVEEYPILIPWKQRQLQNIHSLVKPGIVKGGDKFGNYVYNKDIPVVSDFVGELFHASDSRKNGTTAGAVGAFINGVLGDGLLGTVDGIAELTIDPCGAIENINNVLRRPEESFPAIWNSVKDFWKTNIEEGSIADRSRAAGKAIFDIALLFMGGEVVGGIGKAGEITAEAAEAGRVAAEAAEVGKVAAEAVEVGKVAAEAAEAGRIAAEAAEAGKIAAEAGEAGKIAAEVGEAGKIAAEAAEVGKIAAEAAEAGKIAAELGKAGKSGEIAVEMAKAGETATRMAKAGKSGEIVTWLEETGKSGELVSKIGGVEKAGKAAESMNLGARAGTGEDLAKGFERILKGKGESSELMLKTPDNVCDTKYVSQIYKKLFEEGGVPKSEGGVRINKANGLVDEASNAAGKVERRAGVIERGSKSKWWHEGYIDNLSDTQILLGVKQSNKGLSTLGSSTRETVMSAGKAWVGGNYNIIKDGTGNVLGYSSADGMRAFRIQYKPKEGMWRANFQENIMVNNPYPNPGQHSSQLKNVHIDILD